MDMPVGKTTELDRLLALADAENPYDYDYAEILPRQIAAVNQRFQQQIEQIKLLRNRAETGGVAEVASVADVVPLLLAHTAYKSYPEGWLFEGKWDRMAKWLDTVSTADVAPIAGPIAGLDDWLKKLEEQGHYVACSSGTTGKCAMMNGTPADIAFSGKQLLDLHYWTGINPNKDRRSIGPGLVAATAKNIGTGRPMAEAISKPGVPPFRPSVPPVTIGAMVEMVTLRKKIAEGTALPSEVEHYEAQAARRAADTETAVRETAAAMIEHRGEMLHIMGMLGPLYQVAALIREQGYSGKDFQANTAFFSGGLKRANVPDDYFEVICDTLNLVPERICQAYGMQELNTTAPRCTHGRYHLAPWVLFVLLDEAGENAIPPAATGEQEGRAGFVDVSVEGRWGGVISGDKVRVTYEPCACGNRSPSIAADIQRYADGAGGDKIACAGTIDAYVRGAV